MSTDFPSLSDPGTITSLKYGMVRSMPVGVRDRVRVRVRVRGVCGVCV